MTRKTSGSWSQCVIANSRGTDGTPVPRRGKGLQLRYSISKESQELGEENVENPDCEFPGLPLQFYPANMGKPMSSSMPHFLNTISGDSSENTSHLSTSGSSSSSNGSPRMSSWVSVDCLNRQATTIPNSYASALQHRSERSEKQMAKASTTQQSRGACSMLPSKGRNLKSVQGTQGNKKQMFPAKFVDKRGKVHHGSSVHGLRKSSECKIHTRQSSDDMRTRSHCRYAHPWWGDTLQYICTKCTRNNEPICKDRRNHEMYVWNLGPYVTENGTIWKDTQKWKYLCTKHAVQVKYVRPRNLCQCS